METGAIGRVPVLRLRVLVDRQPRADGVFVAYWMTAARRLRWNFALDRAIGWACQLKRPLAIIEVLGCGGRWDCDRHHCFVLQGMGDNMYGRRPTPRRFTIRM
jgi:deoxyribodipyrimidine photo-lyase